MSRQQLVDGLRLMQRIRFVEDARRMLWARGQLPGAIHGATGQEAAAVGACMALRHDDYISGTHRSHHTVAKGAALAPLMAEFIGRANGVCHGKGGSHLADFAVGSIGEDSIVGASIPIGTGAAMSALARGSGQVALCFFGDGAINQGTFHESLNMAAVWRLPVVYVCENNQYSVVTPTASVSSGAGIAARAAAYGMPVATVDGQCLEQVYDAVDEAVGRARRGEGPSFVEALTYRFREHAEGLPVALKTAYRSEDEVAAWVRRDPISLVERRLQETGMSDSELGAISASVQAEVDEAVASALAGPLPHADDAFSDLFATPVGAVGAVGAEAQR